jgi:hypothetical protein
MQKDCGYKNTLSAHRYFAQLAKYFTVCITYQPVYVRIATIMLEVSFLPLDFVTRVNRQDSQQQKQAALPKSANMKYQPSTPASKLSVGLKYINNTYKFFRVMSGLKLFLSPLTSSGIFFMARQPCWA